MPILAVTWDPELDIEASSDAVLIVDAERFVVATNRHADALLGYPRGELVGRPVRHVLSELPSLSTSVRFVSPAMGVHAFHQNGRAVPVELVLCAIEHDAMVVIVRPPAMGNVALFEEDVAEIVHDLKSPLTTIAIEAQVLGHRFANVGAPSQVFRIERNVAYMDRLVHELLDMCSLDSGRFALERRPVELRGLLQRTLERVLSTTQRQRVSLDAEQSVVVACDDIRIERVLANLLENALKYAPEPSAIIVRLEVFYPSVRVSVIDAGPGIETTEAAHVFDKFRRASTAGMHAGTGLGLYVSRRIIEAHGGRMGVDSTPGRGSRFFFELPVSIRGGNAVQQG